MTALEKLELALWRTMARIEKEEAVHRPPTARAALRTLLIEIQDLNTGADSATAERLAMRRQEGLKYP